MKSNSPQQLKEGDGQHDEKEEVVAKNALAGQARKSWMEKDKRLSQRNLGTNDSVGSPNNTGRKNSNPSRWEKFASDKTLTAPLSWHGGTSKLSPSKFAAGPLSPPLTAGGSPVARKDDDISLGSSILRGSKVYRIQDASKTSKIQNFLPQSSSSSSRSWIRKPESEGRGRAQSPRALLSSSGISLQALPDRDAIAKSQDYNDALLAEMNPTFSIPFETPYEEDEYEDETVDLNDKNEEPGSEKDEEEGLQVVDRTQVIEYIVDRVPRKMWSSENIQSFPIWPPIIKVRSYEAGLFVGDVSGVSIGSGFTDDDYLTDDFSTDDDGSVADRIRRQAPERRTSYRIRYDGPTSLNLDSYKLDNRFQSDVQRPDGAPNMPSRATDSAPSAPSRRQSSFSSDEFSGDVSNAMEPRARPDVWITALSGDTSQDVLWNVRRVWELEEEDKNEREHSVHNGELFSRIKTLVGAADSPSASLRDTKADDEQKDGLPKMPTRSWQIQKVVERRGKLEDLEPEKELEDEQVNEVIDGMAKAAAVELKQNVHALSLIVQKLLHRRIKKRTKKAEMATNTKIAEPNDVLAPWPANHSGSSNADLLSKDSDLGKDEYDANPVVPPPPPPSVYADSDENSRDGSPLPSVVSPSTKSTRKGRKGTPKGTRKSPRVGRLSKSSGDQTPKTPRRHQSDARSTKIDGDAVSPVSKQGKKKSKKKSKKEKKQVSAAEMYLAASSSSDSEGNVFASKQSPKPSKKEKKRGAPKIRRKEATNNMIRPAAMVQNNSSESDSDSSRSGRSPSQRRDPRLPKGSGASTPWWKKQAGGTPKYHTPKKVARPSPIVKRSPPLSDKKSMK